MRRGWSRSGRAAPSPARRGAARAPAFRHASRLVCAPPEARAPRVQPGGHSLHGKDRQLLCGAHPGRGPAPAAANKGRRDAARGRPTAWILLFLRAPRGPRRGQQPRGRRRPRVAPRHGPRPGLFHPQFTRLPRGVLSPRRELRAQLDAGPGTTVLLSVAMFRPSKNQRALIEMAAGLPKEQDWRLWFVGDGTERAACEALAGRLGLSGRIRFLGFQADRAATTGRRTSPCTPHGRRRSPIS